MSRTVVSLLAALAASHAAGELPYWRVTRNATAGHCSRKVTTMLFRTRADISRFPGHLSADGRSKLERIPYRRIAAVGVFADEPSAGFNLNVVSLNRAGDELVVGAELDLPGDVNVTYTCLRYYDVVATYKSRLRGVRDVRLALRRR